MRGGFGTFGCLSHHCHRRVPGVAASRFICGCLILACFNEAGFSGCPRAVPTVPAMPSDPQADAVPAETARKYDGLTLDEWKQRIKTLGPGVPGAESAIPGLRAIAEDRTVEPAFRNPGTCD